MDSIVNLVFM